MKDFYYICRNIYIVSFRREFLHLLDKLECNILMKINKLIKKFFLVIVILYVSITFINQQKSINAYNNQQANLKDKIKEQEEYNQTLLATKENISSPEYIEELAREKLDMYLPNEKVYIDIGK